MYTAQDLVGPFCDKKLHNNSDIYLRGMLLLIIKLNQCNISNIMNFLQSQKKFLVSIIN